MRSRFLSPLITLIICAIMIVLNDSRAYSFADNSIPPQDPAGPTQDPAASDVAITPLLQYQGRMTSPATGQPVTDGAYAVTFRLYDVASGGTAKWTETKNVPVVGGLFSTALGDTSPLAQSLFSGQAMWLGIKVGSDLEATPRQAIMPVAYALSLVPGATISGSLTLPALRVNNTGSGSALYTSSTTGYGVYGEGNSISGGSGIYGTAPYVGVWGSATGTTGRWGGYFTSQAATGMGVMGVAASATGANYGVYGQTNSPDGYAGYFAGNVKATGEVRGKNTALPIAYGFVNSNGTLASGSPNVSSTWTGSNYQITISGEDYFWTQYVTQVTLLDGCNYGNSVRTGSVGGNLLVHVYSSTGTNVQCNFQFVTYKP